LIWPEKDRYQILIIGAEKQVNSILQLTGISFDIVTNRIVIRLPSICFLPFGFERYLSWNRKPNLGAVA
jgi:hypothetical protein